MSPTAMLNASTPTTWVDGLLRAGGQPGTVKGAENLRAVPRLTNHRRSRPSSVSSERRESATWVPATSIITSDCMAIPR
jgi:hypothetical protein